MLARVAGHRQEEVVAAVHPRLRGEERLGLPARPEVVLVRQ